MQVIDTLSQANLSRPALVTVGAYDGIHIGHQHLLQRMVTAASQQGYASVVVTFYPRPQAVLLPHLPALHLSTPAEKIALLERLGLDVVAMLPFTMELARTPAEQFVRDMLTHLHMRELWVGPDFALGRNREGSLPVLQYMGREMGFEVRIIEPFSWEGELVSSTRIRQLLAQGKVRQAAVLLGRYPSLSGLVASGAQRGRRVGFPTANIAVFPELAIPADGVYASFVWVSERHHPAVTNIGVRPTFGAGERTVESYLFDYNGDLYGMHVKVELVEYLRPEIHFGDAAVLAAQIRADIVRAADILGTSTPAIAHTTDVTPTARESGQVTDKAAHPM